MNLKQMRKRYFRLYREKNKEKIKQYKIEYNKKYQPIYNKQRQKRLIDRRLKIIFHYTKGKNMCQCCGEKNLFFLSIDHKNGHGKQHRKDIKISGNGRFYKWIIDNKFPKILQILCFNCNMGKIRNKGVCPHKKVIHS